MSSYNVFGEFFSMSERKQTQVVDGVERLLKFIRRFTDLISNLS